MTKPDELETWARLQKRVTNRSVRERFNVDEETAQGYYDYLKMVGIVGSMGYVNEERGK